MERDKQIKDILEINNTIIKTKSNDPNNYFKMKFNKYKLLKQVNKALDTYKAGPSTPSI